MSYLEKVLSGINKRKNGSSYIINAQLNSNYRIRSEIHQGKKHIVVPVIMMVEGVHNGSAGPLLHLAEDLGRFPEAWNGIPVTVQHPEEDGHNVSANTPVIIDSERVGRIYNTHMDSGKLKAEIWLDEERLREVSAIALAAIQQQQALEVSIGVFTEEETVPGTWNNIQYEAIARNHRPDHLALLPGGQGACSWNDGCGIRANIKKGGKKPMDKQELIQMAKSLSKEGYSVVSLLNDNEQGLRELITNIQTKLDGMDDNIKIHYLQEVYDDYFIYEIRRSGGDGSTLYKRTYQVNADGSVEFTGEPFEVRRKVEYVVMQSSGFIRTKFNKSKEEVKTMNETKEETPCCEDLVNELIANERTKLTKDDKEWLMTMEETQLQKFIPNESKAEAPQINVEQVKQAVRELFSKPEEYIALMPEEMQDQLRAGLKLHKEQREKMIKGVLDNTKDIWTEDSLKVMNADTLQKVYDSIKTEVVDYSGFGGNGDGEKGQEPLYLGGTEIEKEKK